MGTLVVTNNTRNAHNIHTYDIKKYDYRSDRHPRAGCFVINGNKILVLKQSSSGFWGPPKGGLNIELCRRLDGTYYKKFENVVDGAIRETREEIGIDVNERDFKGPIQYKNHTYFITRFYSGKPKPDGIEILDYKWVTYDELLSMNISNTTRRMLRQLRLWLNPDITYV